MKILFLAIQNSTFIERDYIILKEQFQVNFPLPFPKNFLKTFFLIKKCNLVFCWFTSLHFLLPIIIAKILHKKIVIVSGGYDVANVYELNYGSMVFPLRGFLVKLMLKLADNIVAVSKSNMLEVIENCKISSSKIELIYHGFDDRIVSLNSKRENKILTVGLLDKETFLRKGFDRFLELAKCLTDFHFVIAGRYDPDFVGKLIIPPNVYLTGYLDHAALLELFLSSKIYVQLSRHEAFGAAVAEAMLAGCVPFVSNAYALPEVVGDCGVIIDNMEEVNKTSQLLENLLLNFSDELSFKCSERIKNTFSVKARRKNILKLLNNIYK